MIPRWLDKVLNSTAGRGRELLQLFSEQKDDGRLDELCHAILSGSGEASAIALAGEILRRYGAMTPEQQQEFFQMLYDEFSPKPENIRRAANAYFETHSEEDLLALTLAVEAPRQEMLRRLNMAPHSTAQLVAMRGDLLRYMKQAAHLNAVDSDFKHLLSSWFNRGFLQLRRIDWNTPALVLEKLIGYESVHEIQGWDDLRRRLDNDRRCFAFFHPAIPDEPLIFVEVALVKGIPAHVQPLLDCNAPVLDLDAADTAVFYSINNTQFGLRGISFGNFLIKQVMEELQNECPWIAHFVTLSPMPIFADTLNAALEDKHPKFTHEKLNKILAEYADDLQQRSGMKDTLQGLMMLLKQPKPENLALLSDALKPVALAYLTLPHHKYTVTDPVAAFHLSNGASLESINPFADNSRERIASSFGCMVNYLYNAEEVEINHEAFFSMGKIALSRPLAKLHDKIRQEP